MKDLESLLAVSAGAFTILSGLAGILNKRLKAIEVKSEANYQRLLSLESSIELFEKSSTYSDEHIVRDIKELKQLINNRIQNLELKINTQFSAMNAETQQKIEHITNSVSLNKKIIARIAKNTSFSSKDVLGIIADESLDQSKSISES